MPSHKRKPTYSLETIIHRKSLASWDSGWNYIENGFIKNNPNLNGMYGLFGAKLNGQFVYIGTGAAIRGRGLNQALARIRTTNPSGDFGGIRALREIIDDVEAYILPIAKDLIKEGAAANVLRGMLAIHSPIYNASWEVQLSAIKQSYAL